MAVKASKLLKPIRYRRLKLFGCVAVVVFLAIPSTAVVLHTVAFIGALAAGVRYAFAK